MAEEPELASSKYTILVVDDEELIRNLLVSFLSKLGHFCITANNGVEALHKLRENKPDAIITDIRMPEMDGIFLTREVSREYPDIPVMVMTAYDEEYSAGTAISAGAREFIKKPFSLDEFAIRLHKMITDSEAIRRVQSEKKAEDDVQDLMNELEETLKKG